jgi:hypothetical protein
MESKRTFMKLPCVLKDDLSATGDEVNAEIVSHIAQLRNGNA